MLLDQPAWLVRRKLSIELLDETWHARRLTVDYEITPRLVSRAQELGVESIAVPISLLEKAPGQTISYDLLDGSETRLPMPTLDERLAISEALVAELADRTLTVDGRKAVDDRIATLAEATGERRPTAGERNRALRSLRALRDMQELWRNEASRLAFFSLVGSLIDRVLVVVPVQAKSSRSMIKLRFLGAQALRARGGQHPARAGLEPWPFTLLVAAWRPRSMHVEVLAPPGLEIIDARLDGLVRGEQPGPDRLVYRLETTTRDDAATIATARLLDATDATVPRGSRTHLYRRDPPDATELALQVDLRVSRSGFVAAAAWVTATVAVLLAVVTVGIGSFRDHSDGAGALLLAIPGFGAALVLQQEAHSLTSRMLTTVRRAVYLSSIVAFGACATLLLDSHGHDGPSGDHWYIAPLAWARDRIPWLFLTALAIYVAMLAYLARSLPAARGMPLRRSHRLLKAVTRPLVSALSWPRS